MRNLLNIVCHAKFNIFRDLKQTVDVLTDGWQSHLTFRSETERESLAVPSPVVLAVLDISAALAAEDQECSVFQGYAVLECPFTAKPGAPGASSEKTSSKPMHRHFVTDVRRWDSIG